MENNVYLKEQGLLNEHSTSINEEQLDEDETNEYESKQLGRIKRWKRKGRLL